MEDRLIQTAAFAKLLGTMNIPLAERPQIMKGVNMFFDSGWPSNYFTVGMAASAGAGLVPFTYEGLGSQAKYKELMKNAGSMKTFDVLNTKGVRVLLKTTVGEVQGTIEAVLNPYPSEDQEQAINLTLFAVRLDGGETLETVGANFSYIDIRSQS